MRWFLFLAAAVWTVIALPVASAESVRQIKWEDLVPPLEKFDDPFLPLSIEQKVALRTIATSREAQKEGRALSPEQIETVKAAEAKLRQDKVDIDGLLASRAEITEKRRKAVESVNAGLDGQMVRLAGYVLPLETNGEKITEFLLVPYVGACIHEPTPPANQIVHVKFPNGFEVSGRFMPVWVQGVMRTTRSAPRLNLVDGSASIPTGYAISASAIEPFRK